MPIPNPEYDKPGYCALCHNPIAEFDGANHITRLLGNARSIQVRLDDTSLMNCTICEKCLESMSPSDTPTLMDSVIKGWSYECDTLIKRGAVRIDGRRWDKELKKEHLDKYDKRYIVERTDSTRWSRETIIDAVYDELIKLGEEEAKKKGIKWPR
jgi:hypothetical protein